MPTYRANPGQEKMQAKLRLAALIYLLTISGSRAGKTFEFVRTIVTRALLAPNSRHVIIRKHFAQAKKYIWLDTLPAVISICYPELKGNIDENKSDFYYKLPNGSEIWVGGLDNKDRADKILGGEYNTIYFNECSEISWDSASIALTRLAKKVNKINGSALVNKAYFDCNPPNKNHWVYKLFIEKIDPETRTPLKIPDKYDVVKIHPVDNLENLSEDYISALEDLTGDKRKRFYDGEFQDNIKGALWDMDMINKSRVHSLPELIKITVPIDPATTSTEDSDETGIMVTGKDARGHYYVIDDISGYYTPNGWAGKAISAYKKYRADRIIGEANNGGDMIETVLKNIDQNLSYKKVWASRGKITRAEPVAALYEVGKVHHIREFIDLEYEMTTYTGKPGEKSPNRLDALVWGISSLMDEKEKQDLSKLTGYFH